MSSTNPQDLIERALAEPADSESRWTHVMSLHRLGDEETFRGAVELCRSDEPARRTLGVEILGQLGADKPRAPYRSQAVEILLQALPREGDPSVLQAIGAAFGHLRDPRCVDALRRLRHHPDDDVRHSVVFGLLGHDADLAVDTRRRSRRAPTSPP